MLNDKINDIIDVVEERRINIFGFNDPKMIGRGQKQISKEYTLIWSREGNKRKMEF